MLCNILESDVTIAESKEYGHQSFDWVIYNFCVSKARKKAKASSEVLVPRSCDSG